jgi:tRNA isopentenyl-2-thiomethyl-A-37 hydroxylase MiaE
VSELHRHLQRLGILLRPLPAAPYASRLNQHLRRHEPEHLLDALLVAAIIEARSHERLSLLGIHLPDPGCGSFTSGWQRLKNGTGSCIWIWHWRSSLPTRCRSVWTPCCK